MPKDPFTTTSLVCALALGLSGPGCSTVELSDDSRRSIRAVSVSPDVAVEGSYSGSLPGAGVETRGAVFYGVWITVPVGMIYDIIDWSDTRKRRAQAIARIMRGNDIDVGAVTRAAFVRRLDGSGLFGRTLNWGGDAEFRLRVEYGLSDGFAARGSWKPWLEVEGELVSPSGDVLWRRDASISSWDERLPEFHDPFRDPERLQNAYALAARILADELVEHLRGG